MARTKFAAVSVAALLALAACAPIEGRETAGQYVDDATISSKIRAELVKDQALKAFDIHVETLQGVVQLSGFVGSPTQKAEAENIVRSVRGVRGLQDNIIVRAGEVEAGASSGSGAACGAGHRAG
jgi:hyperosmotically inducible periplasmic protein